MGPIDLGDFVQVVGIVLGAIIFAVGLREQMKNLSIGIAKLTVSIDRLDDRTDAHDVMLAQHAGDIERLKQDIREAKRNP